MKVYVDEMPKSCDECKFCKIETQVEFVGYTTNSYKCLLNGSMLTNNCPLQSLADHDKKVRADVVAKNQALKERWEKLKNFVNMPKEIQQWDERFEITVDSIKAKMQELEE